jgi:hypothetical protein
MLAAAPIGCGGAHGADGPVSSQQSTTDAVGTVQRSCDTAGQNGLSPDYRHHALVVGPLSLGSVRDLPRPGDPLPRVGARLGALEVIVVVPAGRQATLTIPRVDRSHVRLIYDQSKFRDDGAYLLRTLDSAVHFTACQSRRFNNGVSQFDGGFVVDGRRCVRFSVREPGSAVRTGRFPLGARCD